jgi:hypothetical protein
MIAYLYKVVINDVIDSIDQGLRSYILKPLV